MGNSHHILVGLGGNLPSGYGSPVDTMREAVRVLGDEGLENISVSGLYQTTPVPVSEQPDFINCALAANTDLSADGLLLLFKETEQLLGRKPAERWSARTVDIDLLVYEQVILPSPQAWNVVVHSDDPAAFLEQPVVPHPRLHKRAFVLVPLLDVAPDWRHPCLNITVTEMVKNAAIRVQASDVRKISDIL